MDDEGHIGLAYSKIVAVITGALQEQQTMIEEAKRQSEAERRKSEELRDEVETERRKSEALEKRVAALEAQVLLLLRK